jgi:DNA-binding CsgD family transcriptional regulator
VITEFVEEDVKSVAGAVIEGIRAGFISSVDGNIDLLRSGSSIGLDCWVVGVGAVRPRTTAIAGVLPANGEPTPEIDASFARRIDPGRIVLATLDDDWRVVEVASGSAGHLGWPEPGATTVMPRLQDLAHPSDAATLDRSFERRTSTEPPDTFTLRLRGLEEQWLSARVTVSPLHGQTHPGYGLVASLLQRDESDDAESERVAHLEAKLARIRQVVESTNGDAADGRLERSGLTVRQHEIVQRLLHGHRVDAIARDLYVSPSTIRNHLSAIFEKLGVASQSELVELLRDRSNGARASLDLGAV